MAGDDGVPCESCGRELLDSSMASSRAGELLRAAVDLDFARTAGITLGADDVTCEEFTCLKIMASERAKYEEEIREAQRREDERRRR